MKRDMNLVRAILLSVTQSDDDSSGVNPVIDGYSEEQIAHHVYLMADGGLLEATSTGTMHGGLPSAVFISVTWAGHDFADAAKDDSIWRKARQKLLEPGVAFTFDLLKEFLVQAAKMS